MQPDETDDNGKECQQYHSQLDDALQGVLMPVEHHDSQGNPDEANEQEKNEFDQFTGSGILLSASFKRPKTRDISPRSFALMPRRESEYR